MKIHVKSVIITLSLLFLGSTLCLSQGSLEDFKRTGKLLSESENTAPAGKLGIISYRLEELKLSKPFDLSDGKPAIENAFRLVVLTAQKLPLDTFNIWLDDAPRQAIQITPKSVALIIYARTIPDGMTIALSTTSERELQDRSILSDRLIVPFPYATSPQEIASSQPVISLRRLDTDSPLIELRVDIPNRPCVIGNAVKVFEIDGLELNADCDRDAIIRLFSVTEFARLRDGAEIKFKYGYGRESSSGFVLGRLNKSSIQ